MEAAQKWLAWDRNATTREEIQRLVDSGNTAELSLRLDNRMEFGTAGLRAPMGAGNARMNQLTIIQTTQGLLRYLQDKFDATALAEKGIVVSFDARHNSDQFATIVTRIFDHANIKVYKFSAMTPTPFVPFTVLRRGAVCGVMITASHNPKEDNGYKVYWSNGAQIISPHDSGIAAAINANLTPWETSWQNSSGKNVIDPMPDIRPLYYETVQALQRNAGICAATPLRVTYTAMHGVGTAFVEESFKAFGLPPFIPVARQVQPDPNFPTVPFPNPEEGKSALNLAMETAKANKSSLILANDPDADRLAVAEMQPNGAWKVFTGNELGALLGWWSWTSRPHKNKTKFVMLHSTVSSSFLSTMGKAEGFLVEDTLTGFKWMGNRAMELQAEGYEVLFCFEEAIGFMCGTAVRDKDGVSAAAVCYELAAVLQLVYGRTLAQQLSVLYATYGTHLTLSSYYSCLNPVTTKTMFEEIRNYQGSGEYPKKIAGCSVEAVRDLTTGYDSTTPDKRPRLPSSSSSQMITFRLLWRDGMIVTLTIRGSGTEPKIKYYAELITKTVVNSGLRKDYEALVEQMVQTCYQPEKFGFQPRKV